MRTCLYLLAALVLTCSISGCDYQERYFPNSTEDGEYHFDGSKPIEQIILVPGNTPYREKVYTPQLSSQEYLTLALSLLPRDFTSDAAEMRSAYFESYECNHVERIGSASFIWSVEPAGENQVRRITSIDIRSDIGSVYTSAMAVTGGYALADPRQPIVPSMAEHVLRAAMDKFTATGDETGLFQSPENCSAVAFANRFEPTTWSVHFTLQAGKKIIRYEVDTLNMRVIPKSDDHATAYQQTLTIGFLLVALVIVVACFGVWLLFRIRAKKK